jgi:hypothetical protein
LSTDRWTVRIVVVVLGLVALAVVGIFGALSLAEKPIPTELVAIGSGALGALGALLAKTGSEPTVNSYVAPARDPAEPE